MASLSQVLGPSDLRIRAEVESALARRSPMNALLLGVNFHGETVQWAADVNAVSLPIFAPFTPDEVVAIRVWAWRPGDDFDLVQEYRVRRLGPPAPGPFRLVVLDPLPPPPLLAFRPRLWGLGAEARLA